MKSRIAFLTPWTHDCGIADYSRQLVAALREHVDVRVVELQPRYRGGLMEAMYHRPADLRYYRRLGEQLNDADLAHIQFQYPLFGGFAPWKLKFGALLERVRVPAVLTMHELDHRESGQRLMTFAERRRYFHNASIVTHQQVRAVIVHTKRFIAPLVDLLVPPDYIHYQPMPVPEIVPLPSNEEAKRRLGLAGKRVLALLGFVVRRKGHETALAALAQMPDDVVLAFVGGASAFDRTGYCDQLRATIASSPLASRVTLTGYVSNDEFRDWLAAADVVLAPFDEMSGSSSLTLAFAAEKVIVGSDVPGIMEMTEVLNCIRTCPRGNAAALAAAVSELLADDGMREKMLTAVRVCKAAFAVSNMAKATAAVYTNLLGPASVPTPAPHPQSDGRDV